jgi:hypothetical protein
MRASERNCRVRAGAGRGREAQSAEARKRFPILFPTRPRWSPTTSPPAPNPPRPSRTSRPATPAPRSPRPRQPSSTRSRRRSAGSPEPRSVEIAQTSTPCRRRGCWSTGTICKRVDGGERRSTGFRPSLVDRPLSLPLPGGARRLQRLFAAVRDLVGIGVQAFHDPASPGLHAHTELLDVLPAGLPEIGSIGSKRGRDRGQDQQGAYDRVADNLPACTRYAQTLQGVPAGRCASWSERTLCGWSRVVDLPASTPEAAAGCSVFAEGVGTPGVVPT